MMAAGDHARAEHAAFRPEHIGCLQRVGEGGQLDRIVEKVRSILAGYLVNDPERDKKLNDSMADGIGSKFVEVMTEMRDVLEERGRYTETPVGAPENGAAGAPTA
jgi:hypothetical protein